jgi:V/A-type H+-transporting ATPase subunit E
MEQGKVAKLRQKIIRDAEAEAHQVVEEGEAQAKTLHEEAQAEADRIAAESRAQGEGDAKEYVRRQISLRELEARKAILGEKGEVIEEVFAQALEDLRLKDRECGYKLTRDLLLKAIESGDEEIILSVEDRKAIGSSFVTNLNKEIGRTGKRAEVTLSEETRDIKGGFVLRRGKVEINSRFDTLLSMLRDDVEIEIANILFGKSDKAE